MSQDKTLAERFEAYEDDFLKTERIEKWLSKRYDLHAFLLLDSIQPNEKTMIISAIHDEIWLDFDIEKLNQVITEDQILELVRCGVRVSDDESLCMYV